jgi:hypothetical protein
MGVQSKLLIAGCALAWSGAGLADTSPICAARPGKATPACTVPAKDFQIETGLVDWSKQDNGGERNTSLTIAETVFKYGLNSRSDIELDITPWERDRSGFGGVHQTVSGFGDLSLLYKYRISSEDAALQLAVQPYVTIPTAKHSLGSGKAEAGLLIPVGFTLGNSPFSLGTTPEIDWVTDSDGHGHHEAMEQVVSLGISATKQLSLGAELWGQWDWDPSGTGKQYTADATIAYLAKENVQLDAGANFGLNRQTPDIELYTGVSVRF